METQTQINTKLVSIELSEKQSESLDKDFNNILTKQEQEKIMVMFVNPKSGGLKATEYINLGQEQLNFDYPNLQMQIKLNIFDLMNEESRYKGLDFLKQITQNQNQITRVVVVGGDGTTIWVVEEIQKFGINLSQIALAIAPFGSGNDLANVLGWEKLEPDKYYQSLQLRSQF